MDAEHSPRTSAYRCAAIAPGIHEVPSFVVNYGAWPHLLILFQRAPFVKPGFSTAVRERFLLYAVGFPIFLYRISVQYYQSLKFINLKGKHNIFINFSSKQLLFLCKVV